MQKKTSLFADEPKSKEIDKFTINEDFARKFEYNKRRQLLEQGKLKYGDLLEDGASNEEESESSSSDDSEGELVNPKFEKKFM